MRPFAFSRADSAQAAIQAQIAAPDTAPDAPSVLAPAQYLAGGTTLIDLMKLDVMRPELLTDINALERNGAGTVDIGDGGLRLGALMRMSAAADHPEIRKSYPVIAQALQLAASAQIRNMASLGGNVLQRTRCTYFRDTSYANCNKRHPGSGCAAMEGINRQHAVLGTSDQCIATYPGDFAQALIALEAQVEIAGPNGRRRIPFAQLHKPPGNTPHIETTLGRGELIMAFAIPSTPFAKRSLFLKIRDRASYEFALASAAVALDLDNGIVRDVRIALGGVAALPWRASDAEAQLRGQKFEDKSLNAAALAAFAHARPREHNAFKVELGKRTLVRALRQAAAMEV
jgi:xanthine dehydrogenase YagS FAD-binding subunit